MTALPAMALSLSLGLSLGALGGLLGIGGGLVAIPVLAHLYGMDQQVAQGTALIMILPNVLIGFLRYRQRHAIDLRALASMIVPSIVSAWLASKLALHVDAALLRRLFAAFLVAVAGFLAWRQRLAAHADRARRAPWSRRYYPAVGVASGFMSGLFTIGGGIVVVPALVLLFETQQTTAQGMALAMVVPGAAVALLSYAQSGQVDWAVGLPLALGGALTVSLGVALAHRLSPAVLRRAFSGVLLATAAALLV